MAWPGKIGESAAVALLCLFLMLPAQRTWADDEASELLCPITMTEAVSLEREQIEHLFEKRGIKYLAEGLATDLQGSVESYLSHRQLPDDRRDRALLFFIGNSETLCAMYWRIGDDGIGNLFITERLEATPARIVPLIDGLVQEMQAGASGILRQARPRGDAEVTRGARGLRAGQVRSVEDVLGDLSRILFPGQIASNVRSLSSLTIIPCLNIGIVPFAALDPDADGVPLVESTVVNVEAELRHVYENRAFGWSGAIENPVVIGNPDASNDPDWNFSRLPGAQREAMAVAERFGVTPILGSEATPRRVVDAIREAGYIHLAAHGISSVEHPLDGSFLALTGGRLTARGIQGLDLVNSPLVVLSACQTGLGGPLDAGVIGLARGFVLAGAVGAVATLWNVDDDVTALLMTQLATNLKTMNPPEALRSAQQRVRSMHRHPRYWSGFMLFGSRTIDLPA